MIIGNGGREHPFGLQNTDIAATDIPALVAFAQERYIELTIVGLKVPLVKGVVDAFCAAGLRIFNPTQAAVQLEGSKAFTFSKDFFASHCNSHRAL